MTELYFSNELTGVKCIAIYHIIGSVDARPRQNNKICKCKCVHKDPETLTFLDFIWAVLRFLYLA